MAGRARLAALCGAASLLLLLPLGALRGEPCPARCSCAAAGEARALRVDCGSRGLRALPALPRRARGLRLRNNSLTSVPAGALDGLSGLRELDVADNPWHCDCNIVYLKLWLEDFSPPALAQLRCASPAALRMKPLRELTGNELGDCKRLLPTKCLQFFWRDLVLIALAIITLILAALALKFSKKLVCQLILGGWLLRRHSSKTHKTQ